MSCYALSYKAQENMKILYHHALEIDNIFTDYKRKIINYPHMYQFFIIIRQVIIFQNMYFLKVSYLPKILVTNTIESSKFIFSKINDIFRMIMKIQDHWL